jgi:hypothetical protein
MLFCRILETLLEPSANRQKKEHITCEDRAGDSDVFPSHSVLPRTNRFIVMTNHNFAIHPAWARTRSVRNSSSDLTKRLLVVCCLLSSSLHDWKNSWFMKLDGTAEGYNLSLACPSFGASWGSDSPCLLGNTLQSLPLTLINVVAGLVLSSSLERVPWRSINRLHAFFLLSIDDGEKEHRMSNVLEGVALSLSWIGLPSSMY